MIKGLVITHGRLAQELVAVAETILEEKVDVDAFSIEWEEDGATLTERFSSYLQKNKDNHLIIFTDMFGGSATNICLKFQHPNIEVITGVNLPGLLKFITYRNKDIGFKDIVQIVKKGTTDGVSLISEYLGVKKNDQRNR